MGVEKVGTFKELRSLWYCQLVQLVRSGGDGHCSWIAAWKAPLLSQLGLTQSACTIPPHPMGVAERVRISGGAILKSDAAKWVNWRGQMGQLARPNGLIGAAKYGGVLRLAACGEAPIATVEKFLCNISRLTRRAAIW